MNERLARFDVLGSLGRWISEPANAKRLGEYAAVLLPRIRKSLPAPQIGESVGKLARQALETIPAAPVASKMLAIIWAQGEAQALVAARSSTAKPGSPTTRTISPARYRSNPHAGFRNGSTR